MGHNSIGRACLAEEPFSWEDISCWRICLKGGYALLGDSLQQDTSYVRRCLTGGYVLLETCLKEGNVLEEDMTYFFLSSASCLQICSSVISTQVVVSLSSSTNPCLPSGGL